MDQDMYTTVARILVDTFQVPADEMSADATLESLDLDSLDLVELTLIVEEETGVKIEDDELENIRTVGDAVAAIEKKQAAAA